MTYSLNACCPGEGYRAAINGTEGRRELIGVGANESLITRQPVHFERLGVDLDAGLEVTPASATHRGPQP